MASACHLTGFRAPAETLLKRAQNWLLRSTPRKPLNYSPGTRSIQSFMPTSSSPVSGKSQQKPPVPRLSASLVVVNAENQILLVQRNIKASTFGGVYVFPGGNFDTKQDDSTKMTAIRETFEESGLLVATDTSKSSKLSLNQIQEARHAVHSQTILFKDFLASHGVSIDNDSLLPFTQWVTPIYAPRRFHAFFYVVFLPSASSLGFTSGTQQNHIPTSDGGQEVINAQFIHPKQAITEFRANKLSFMPPQYYIIETLASVLEGNENTERQREKVAALSCGPFGRMVINPVKLPDRDAEGRTVLTYEGDETRGGPPGQLHRSLVKLAEGGVITTEIILKRTFDIYTGVNWNDVPKPAKL